MAPRGYDRFMVAVEISSSLKIARLSDREFRCLVCGVWPVAAKATPRGYLAVAGQPATAEDVAHQARVPVPAARRTLERLRTLGMLEMVSDVGLEYCHDWHDLNPDPVRDETAAERQRKHRDKQRRNGTVTRDSHADVTQSVTDVTAPEVEVEVEVPASQVNTNAELRSAVIECFAYWQERCNHQQATLSADRKAKIEARLRERSKHGGGMPRAIRDVRQAIDGAAVAPFVDDKGKRFDDIELICRKGSKLEDFMGRATLPQSGRVVPLRPGRQSPSDLLRSMAEAEAAERIPDAEIVDDEEAS